MNAFFLLIILTQNGAGDINASFVNTDTLQQCQQKAQMVEGVFIAAEIAVIESRCIRSDMQFSQFGHASASSKIINFYRIKFTGEQVQISKVADWRSCMQHTKSNNIKPGQGGIYCSSSIQTLR